MAPKYGLGGRLYTKSMLCIPPMQVWFQEQMGWNFRGKKEHNVQAHLTLQVFGGRFCVDYPRSHNSRNKGLSYPCELLKRELHPQMSSQLLTIDLGINARFIRVVSTSPALTWRDRSSEPYLPYTCMYVYRMCVCVIEMIEHHESFYLECMVGLTTLNITNRI